MQAGLYIYFYKLLRISNVFKLDSNLFEEKTLKTSSKVERKKEPTPKHIDILIQDALPFFVENNQAMCVSCTTLESE